jgi:hypothetical protein
MPTVDWSTDDDVGTNPFLLACVVVTWAKLQKVCVRPVALGANGFVLSELRPGSQWSVEGVAEVE